MVTAGAETLSHRASVAAITGSPRPAVPPGPRGAAILAEAGPTLATAGNLNNHIGVPLTLLGINASHEMAVVALVHELAGRARLDDRAGHARRAARRTPSAHAAASGVAGWKRDHAGMTSASMTHPAGPPAPRPDKGPGQPHPRWPP